MNPDWMIAQAAQAHDAGASERALELLKRALALEPDSAFAHALLALVLVGRKRLHAAELEAKIALGIDPESPFVHLAAGQVAFARRRFKVAVAELEQAAALAPEDEDPVRILAEVKWALGERKAAEELVQRALALNPDDPAVHSILSRFRLQQNRLDDAERHARDALSIDPEHADAAIAMGYVLLRRGHPEEAKEHAVSVLHQDPSSSAALHLIAAIKARQSFALGLWWRYNTWVAAQGARGMILLAVAFLVYRLALAFTKVHQLGFLEDIVVAAWLGICIYTWAGPAMFARAIRKELDEVELDPEF